MRHAGQFPAWVSHLLTALPFFVAQFGFDFGGLGDALLGFFANILAFLEQVIVFIWNTLVYVANVLWAVIQAVGQFLLKMLSTIGRAFTWLWDNVVKKVLTRVVGVIRTVRDWLSRVFGPLLKYLKLLRAWLDKIFRLYIQPVLNLIHHLRQVLTLFRILGFKWAKRLDARLAQIERRIFEAYNLVRKELNRVASILELALDPFIILRRNPLFAAIIRNLHDLRNVLDLGRQRPLTTGEQDVVNRDLTRFTKSTLDEYSAAWLSGQDPQELAQVQDALHDQLSGLSGEGIA